MKWIAFFLLFVSVAFAQAPAVRQSGAFDGPEPVVKALEPHGHAITISGHPYAEIWFSKTAPAAPPKADPGAVYAIADGSFLGVVRFAVPVKDFRGQPVKPGTYTLRYAVLPGDGNHMGAAAQPDFGLLVPLAADSDPATPMPHEALMKASARAAGSNHPASFSLVPADGVEKFPSIETNADGFVVFAAKVPGAKGAAPFAIVVKGWTVQ